MNGNRRQMVKGPRSNWVGIAIFMLVVAGVAVAQDQTFPGGIGFGPGGGSADIVIDRTELAGKPKLQFKFDGVVETSLTEDGWSGGTWSGQILAADGTPSLPGVAFALDADTGFYRHAVDTVGVSTGGSVRALLASNFTLRNTLKLEWGSSGVSTPDTNLYRDSANVLKTDDAFVVGGASLSAALVGAASGNFSFGLVSAPQWIVRSSDGALVSQLTGNGLVVGGAGGFISAGASPSGSGIARFPNNNAITFNTFVPGTNVQAMYVSTANVLVLGDANAASVLLGSASIDTTVGGDLTVSGTGPHAIGGPVHTTRALSLIGAFTSSGSSAEAASLYAAGVLTGAGGDTGHLASVRFNGQVITQTATESIGDISQVRIEEPSITNNLTGTITNASTVLITGAPTEGANNYALLIDSGDARFGGAVIVVSSSAPVIASQGALYYDTDSNELCIRTNSAWVGLIAAGACA